MTNEQLKILLENQAALLRIAIEKAVELMPDDSERVMEWVYVGNKSTLQTLASATTIHAGGRKKDPDWEEKPTGKHLILIPLYDHLESIERQIDSFPLAERQTMGYPA
ncbi:MAG: hypothetical protein GWP06_06075 [Actinobacteria bacterium]|nr:hypothetical protein [Actinomycetota bacterium]